MSVFTREYKCGGRVYKAHPKACFFCRNMAHLLWDYTHGIYNLFCDVYHDVEHIETGMLGKCKSFDEEADRPQAAEDGARQMSEDILRKAIQTYGKERQLLMAIEEMSELTKAICNYNRGRESNIAEEMADVYIMMTQLEMIFENSKEVAMWIKLKTDRLSELLKYDKAREKYKRPDNDAG